MAMLADGANNFVAQGDMRARERLEELKRGAARRKRDRVSRSDVGRKNEGECAVM